MRQRESITAVTRDLGSEKHGFGSGKKGESVSDCSLGKKCVEVCLTPDVRLWDAHLDIFKLCKAPSLYNQLTAFIIVFLSFFLSFTYTLFFLAFFPSFIHLFIYTFFIIIPPNLYSVYSFISHFRSCFSLFLSFCHLYFLSNHTSFFLPFILFHSFIHTLLICLLFFLLFICFIRFNSLINFFFLVLLFIHL